MGSVRRTIEQLSENEYEIEGWHSNVGVFESYLEFISRICHEKWNFEASQLRMEAERIKSGIDGILSKLSENGSLEKRVCLMEMEKRIDCVLYRGKAEKDKDSERTDL